MTDRDSAQLRGPVKSCSVEKDYVSAPEPWVLHTEDVFSVEGGLLARRHRNPGGPEWSVVCRYDSQSRLVEKINTKAAGVEQFQYWYDPQGRLERVMLNGPGAYQRIFESRQYASDGSQTVSTYPWLDEAKRRTGVSADSALHCSDDAASILTFLDAGGRPTRKVLYDEDERVIRRIGFRYDERGWLLEEGEWIGGCIRDFRNSYEYDALGRTTRMVKRWSDIHTEHRTFAYNGRGDVIEESIHQESGLLLTGNPGSQSWIERFTFQYDERGNWLERRTETILQSGETRVSMVDRRQLTYY